MPGEQPRKRTYAISLSSEGGIRKRRRLVDDTQRVVNQSRELDRFQHFVETLEGAVCEQIQSGYCFIRDILPGYSIDDAKRLTNAFQRCQKKTGNNSKVYIIGHHAKETQDQHIHLYHTCRYHQSNCRCAFLTGFLRKRKCNNDIFRQSNCIRDTNYIQNILQYLVSPQRSLVDIQVGETNYRKSILGFEDLRETFGNVGRRPERPLEACELQNENHDSDGPSRVGQHHSDSQSSESYVARIIEGLSRSQDICHQAKKVNNLLWLSNAIFRIWCVPVETTCSHPMWVLDENLMLYNDSNTDYKLAIDRVKVISTRFTIQNLIDIQTADDFTGVYMSRDDDFPIYFSIEESVYVLEKLLKHQYSDPRPFLLRLHRICEKLIPKRNAIFIHGEPNAGKNFFFDMVASFYFNVGNVNNPNRTSNFPYNDCPNRRILLWNEPVWPLSELENIKKLTGGDQLTVNVKFKSDGTVNRTPVIFLSNTAVLANEGAFASRVFFERWKSAPFLVNYDRKPHPLAYPALLRQYDIID